MIAVEFRSGRKLVAEVKAHKGGKNKKDVQIVANLLEYARKVPLAGKRSQCEKYIEHHFDGTLADYIVCTKFERSSHETRHPLCEEHAQELYDYLAESLINIDPPTPSDKVAQSLFDEGEEEGTPVSNTGVDL